MRRLILSVIYTIFFLSVSATGDSLSYLTAKDTIFLNVDDFGNKIFVHTMEKGQTLYSLAKFYGMKVYHLVAFNTHIEPELGFSPGTAVSIPIPDSAITKTYEYGYNKAGFVPVYYMVKHGDTFYRIAKHFFDIPLDTLQRWNQLEQTMLFTGMRLHVGYISLEGIPDSLQESNYSPVSSKMQAMEREFKHRILETDPSFQNGAAYWQREKKGGNDYYCLHRKAKIGSVIKIKNPMRHKTTYAKVIARIPERAYGRDIIIILSPTIAKILGARDPKFYVELQYLEQ